MSTWRAAGRWVWLAMVIVGACGVVFVATWPTSCWDNFTTFEFPDSCSNRLGHTLPAMGHRFNIYAMRDALRERAVVATTTPAIVGLLGGAVLRRRIAQ